jgi:multidrug efflux pump subunit AcrA (membrane-fusion protein)
MSKKLKKRKQSRRLWFWLIGGGVLLIAIGFFLLMQRQENEPGTPILKVEPERIDYGNVKFNTPKSFEITVTNVGDGTLRFKEEPTIRVQQGC